MQDGGIGFLEMQKPQVMVCGFLFMTFKLRTV